MNRQDDDPSQMGQKTTSASALLSSDTLSATLMCMGHLPGICQHGTFQFMWLQHIQVPSNEPITEFI